MLEFISQTVANIILFIGENAQIFWQNLQLLDFSVQQITVDILLVAVIFYFIFSLLQGSRAIQILIGLIVVAILYAVSKIFQLVALGWLMDRFLTVVLIAIPIIFQKELRLGLERLGNTKIFLHQQKRRIDHIIASIADASDELAQSKHGALIVIEHTIPLKEFIDTGIPIEAKISSELLTSIFRPNSPLHDGAVIITGDKIQAASCILPHSFEKTASGLGTRHKAALGLSENTDASIVVVSEEKGTISFAKFGKIQGRLGADQLQNLLHKSLQPPKKTKRRRRNNRGN